jgi:hypothetical protein
MVVLVLLAQSHFFCATASFPGWVLIHCDQGVTSFG